MDAPYINPRNEQTQIQANEMNQFLYHVTSSNSNLVIPETPLASSKPEMNHLKLDTHQGHQNINDNQLVAGQNHQLAMQVPHQVSSQQGYQTYFNNQTFHGSSSIQSHIPLNKIIDSESRQPDHGHIPSHNLKGNRKNPKESTYYKQSKNNLVPTLKKKDGMFMTLKVLETCY